MGRSRIIVLAAGFAAATTLAGAQSLSSPAEGPPPPETVDDAGVKAWIDKYLKTSGWTLISADGAAVSFGGPDGVFKLADGNLKSDVRREYYRSVEMGGMATRSNLQTWIVDCAGKRIQITAMSIHADNNLAGRSLSRQFETPAWGAVSAGSQNERVLKRICEAPTTGQRLR